MSRSKSGKLCFLAAIALLSGSLLVASMPNWVRGNLANHPGSIGPGEARMVKGNEPIGQTVFEGSDVDSLGNVFVGCNYGIYKSVDNGTTFTLVFAIPFQPDPWTTMAGRIWCVYVDSRDYVFVSAISTNRLYRSADGGASFTEVLNLNRAANEAGIINMDEDELGNLYACEYGASKSARLFKSNMSGELGSWSSIRDFDTRHLHNVRMNPYNNWLYVATSEDSGLGDTESRSIFRSKDHGISWTHVVQQPSSLSGFVAIAFCNDWVVLGEDNAGGYSSIDRFRDDGHDSLFVTQTVWTDPYATNFYGGTKLGNHLVFATGREGQDGTLYVLESTDGQNWNVVDHVFTSSNNDNYRGILNSHPNRNGRIYTCQVAGSATYYTISAPVVDGIISPHEYDGGIAVRLTGQWDTNWTVDTYIWWDTEYMFVAVNEPVPGPTTGRVSWIEVCFDAGPARAYLDCLCFFDDGSLQYCGYPKPSGGWAWYSSPYPWTAVTDSATEFEFKYTDYGISYGDTIKMAIDRNLGPPPPYPLGKSAYWPGHEEIVYPTPDLAKWANVTLGLSPGHFVDGTISPGEYAGGMAVQLVGPYPSEAPFAAWTTDAYISWDAEYLYVAVNESVPSVGPDGPLHSWIEFQFDAPGGYDSPAYHSFVLWDDRSLQYVHYPKPGGPWHWDGPVPSGTGGTALFPYRWWAVTDTATEFKVKYTDFGIAYGDTIKTSIDRGKNDLTYFPYGECAVWPNPCTFYPTADSATWGNVTLGESLQPDQHLVDGSISAGEYDGGKIVQLIGRTDPNWIETAYIDWGSEYLYVAVNESVPSTSGHTSWIEFAIDAGPSRTQLDAFALFDDHVQSHVVYPKPSGPWRGIGSGGFLAASNTATEFRVKYTDFGINLGDTIKLAIDRNFGPAPPPPYGFAAFCPQNATVYDGTPNKADPTTWGNVTLTLPPQPDHVMDGVIGLDEYNGGMAVQLVGRSDSGWKVNAYIDWDSQYLYVAVNESVPSTSGHTSWIEFAIDPGSASSYLYAFVLFDDHVQAYDKYMKPSGSWVGQGSGNFSAKSSVATEFKVKYTDYGIELGDTIKLSIDRNKGPSPPPPYGSAAFWPQNATVYDGTPIQAVPTTWGNVTLKPLGLQLALVDPDLSKPFEYSKTFEIEVCASTISGNLTDYNFTVAYDSSLMNFLRIENWGVLGAGRVNNATLGIIQIWNDAAGLAYDGPRGLLVALTFRVVFNDDSSHIWRTDTLHELNASVSIRNDVGELSLGNTSIPMANIILPAPLAVTVHLIRGDVDCNGKVDVFDLHAVAYYYDKVSTDPEWPIISKYDIVMDNTIDIFDLVAVATALANG